MLDLLHHNEIYSIIDLTVSTRRVCPYCFKITLNNVFYFTISGTVSIFLSVAHIIEGAAIALFLWEKIVSLWTKSSRLFLRRFL